MQFTEILAGRRSIKSFDPQHAISDTELKILFERVILSPSSFNLQHWRFVVIRNKALKARLRKAAYDQEQIENAAATIVVAARLTAHEDAPTIYANAPEAARKAMLSMIDGFYSARPQMQRDEAIRSASLAAMTLMYAAYDMGFATCPMIGFDPKEVSDLIGLDREHMPVMLVVMGRQVGDVRPRAARHPVAEVVKLDSFHGPGLE